MADEKGKKSILFNLTKHETHHPNNGFKKLFRRLKSTCRVQANKDEISKEKYSEWDVVVFGGSRDPFSKEEFEEMKNWLNSGGRALILTGDGGERESGCNFNEFTKEYGMTANPDSVMRSVFYKYLHPKEVFIAEGVLVPDLARKKNSVTIGNTRKSSTAPEKKSNRSTGGPNEKLGFVFPYGSTLTIHRPSRPLLSSGSISYPMNRPICGVWESETVTEAGARRGRMVLLGSTDIFSDDWLDKEENAKLCDLLFAWLLGEVEVDMTSDRQDSELADFTPIPNLEALSLSLKPCLQSMDPLPRDFTKAFDLNMFRFDTDLIPQTIRIYELLGVPHEPLTLIPPQFECPMPKLTPAVFPPIMRELPAPLLDQFDLDDHFAKEDIRLAQLTNKCKEGSLEDVEYYISESGEILGVVAELPFGERSPKHILFHIFSQIVNYKKSDGGKAAAEAAGRSKDPFGKPTGVGVAGFDGGELESVARYGITPAFELQGEDPRGGPHVQAQPFPVSVQAIDYSSMKDTLGGGGSGRVTLQALDSKSGPPVGGGGGGGGRGVGAWDKDSSGLGAGLDSKPLAMIGGAGGGRGGGGGGEAKSIRQFASDEK